jgi:hypothetical protein
MMVFWNMTSRSRITSTKSRSFCMKAFSAGLTNLTALFPQSRDCSCYISRRLLVNPPLWLQIYTDLRALDLAHSPELWYQARLANFICFCSWRLFGINPVIINLRRLKASHPRRIQLPYLRYLGHAVLQLVEALRYKSEGREFDSRWYHWNFS